MRTETTTEVTTSQRIALGFMIATAALVVVSVTLAGIGTLVGTKQATSSPTGSTLPADRAFQTR